MNQPSPRFTRHPDMPHLVVDHEHPDDPPKTVGEVHADYLMGWGRELADLRVGADLRQGARPARSIWRWLKRN